MLIMYMYYSASETYEAFIREDWHVDYVGNGTL